MKKTNILDLLKFLMAFLVIASHTNPLASCTNSTILLVYNQILSFCVPAFMLASGFLLAQRMDFSNPAVSAAVAKKHCRKLLKLYLIWSVIYLPLAVWEYVQLDFSPVRAVLVYLRDLVFVGEHYNSWMLWYILASFYTMLCIFLLFRFGGGKRHLAVLCAAGIVLFCGTGYLLYNAKGTGPLLSIRHLLAITIVDPRIFMGLIYIPIGMFLEKKNLPIPAALLLVLSGLLCKRIGAFPFPYFHRILFSIGLFSLIVRLRLNDSPVYHCLRTMSTVMYFMHMWVWTIYTAIRYRECTSGMDAFLVTSAVCVVLGGIWHLRLLRQNNPAVKEETS